MKEKKIDHLDLATIAKREFDIDAIEYVTSYFSEHVTKDKYVKQMNQRAAEEGVRQILIVVDDAGELASSDNAKRAEAIKAHVPWIDLAKTLGCHSVCVRMAGDGSAQEQFERARDSLTQLAETAKDRRIHVLVCCDCGKDWQPATLIDLVKAVNSRNLGLYPSFSGMGKGDASEALKQLMPYAKGVRATSKEFDDQGNETSTDFFRMVQVVLDAGYRGHVSIQYQGTKLDEMNGIRRTKALLERALAAQMYQKQQPQS